MPAPKQFKDVVLDVTSIPTYEFKLHGWSGRFIVQSSWMDFSLLRNNLGQDIVVRWEDDTRQKCEIMSTSPSLLLTLSDHIPEPTGTTDEATVPHA